MVQSAAQQGCDNLPWTVQLPGGSPDHQGQDGDVEVSQRCRQQGLRYVPQSQGGEGFSFSAFHFYSFAEQFFLRSKFIKCHDNLKNPNNYLDMKQALSLNILNLKYIVNYVVKYCRACVNTC